MPTIYFTGRAVSGLLPLTPGAFQTTNNALINCGGNVHGCGNAFVAGINPGGGGASDLLYSTYIGGSVVDSGTGVAVDALGRVVITGWTQSSDYPVTQTALQRHCGCNAFNFVCVNAVVSVLDPAASGAAQLFYSTFYGGGCAGDAASSLALDNTGNAYITGVTGSGPENDPHTHTPGFPITRGVFQPNPGGGGDAFVAKISGL